MLCSGIMSKPKGTALVTGGARRIGADLARALADYGFDIVLHYWTSHDAARAVAGEIRTIGRECELLRCDLNDERDTATLIERADQLLPQVSLLINNAAVFEPAGLTDTERDFFDRHFNINFKAPFFLVRDFCRNGRTGHVINMLDTRIAKNEGSHMAYTLAKKALFEFTKMAAKELGPGIRVNGISPGLILPPPSLGTDYLEAKSVGIPLNCIGDTGSLTAAVLFLIENPFVTGECLFIDGGEHL